MPGQLNIFVLGDCPRASGNADVHGADTLPGSLEPRNSQLNRAGDVSNVFSPYHTYPARHFLHQRIDGQI